jgi:phage recombination protein Bet
MNNLALQATRDLISFDDAKLALIRKTVCADLDPLEFDFFIAVARARGLDPVLRQIHAVKRQGKMAIQVGIDGFRLIAGRTGEYAGCDETEYEYEGTQLKRCKLTIYRMVKGIRCAFTATARWSEYVPEGNQAFMWKKMPETMLGKVCEALALRKAFPADLSALYLDEEMHQADAGPQVAFPPPPKDVTPQPSAIKFPDAEHERMVKAFAKLNVTKNELLHYFDVERLQDLTPEMVDFLRKMYDQIKSGQTTKQAAFTRIEDPEWGDESDDTAYSAARAYDEKRRG